MSSAIQVHTVNTIKETHWTVADIQVIFKKHRGQQISRPEHTPHLPQCSASNQISPENVDKLVRAAMPCDLQVKCRQGTTFTSGDRERDGLLLGLRFFGLAAGLATTPFAGWEQTLELKQHK